MLMSCAARVFAQDDGRKKCKKYGSFVLPSGLSPEQRQKELNQFYEKSRKPQSRIETRKRTKGSQQQAKRPQQLLQICDGSCDELPRAAAAEEPPVPPPVLPPAPPAAGVDAAVQTLPASLLTDELNVTHIAPCGQLWRRCGGMGSHRIAPADCAPGCCGFLDEPSAATYWTTAASVTHKFHASVPR